MNSPLGSAVQRPAAPPGNFKTIAVSLGICGACFALYFAEGHGFRIFDENVRALDGEPIVPSPLEILTLLGVTSLGVCAGLVAITTAVLATLRLTRHAHDETPENPTLAAHRISS